MDSAAVAAALGALGPEATAVARAVAVLGDDATLPHLTAVTGLAEVAVADALAALVEAGVLLDGVVTRFAAAVAAGTVVACTSPAELAQLHQRAASALHDVGAEATVVAQHLVHAAPVRQSWAVDVLRAAARHRRAAGDQASAVAFLRRCLDERPPEATRVEVLLELGAAEARFAPDEAICHYREVIPLLDDRARRFEARLRLARCLSTVHRVHEAVEEAGAAGDDAADAAERLRAELALISSSRQSLDTRPIGRSRLERIQVGPDSLDTPPGRALIGELAYEQVLAGRPVAGVVANAMAALGGENLPAIHELPGPTRHVVLLTLCWSGELRTAELGARSLLTRATRRGLDVDAAFAHSTLFNVAIRRGELAAAAESAGVVVAAADQVTSLLPGASGFRAAALAMLGRHDEARAALELPGGLEPWAAAAGFHGYLVGRAQAQLVLGDLDDAYDCALRCGTLAQAMGTVNPAVLPWRSLAAAAAVALGRHEVAAALAGEELELARAFGAPTPIIVALRAVAATHPPEEALPILDEAIDLLACSPNRLLGAVVRAQRAEVLAALGADDEAAVELRRADAEAVATGAVMAGTSRSWPAPLPPDRSPALAPRVRETSAPVLQIRALGGFAVLDANGKDVTPPGLAGKAVRVLVAANAPLHLEQLADRLWDEPLDLEQTRVRVRNVLSRSRTSAGAVISRRGDLVSLAANVTVDADVFDRAARAALADPKSPEAGREAAAAALLYQGDLLPTDPFSDWAVLRREELRLRYLSVADLAARLAAEAGLVDVAVDLTESAIRHDPYDEDRYLRAAAFLGGAGRPSAANAMRARAERVRRSLGR